MKKKVKNSLYRKITYQQFKIAFKKKKGWKIIVHFFVEIGILFIGMASVKLEFVTTIRYWPWSHCTFSSILWKWIEREEFFTSLLSNYFLEWYSWEIGKILLKLLRLITAWERFHDEVEAFFNIRFWYGIDRFAWEEYLDSFNCQKATGGL